MKILVIQQKMLGDVLTSSILCKNLKEFLPQSEVHYMVHTNSIPVILNNPYIDKIIDFKPDYRTNKIKFFRYLYSIKKESYDAVIDVYGKLETNLITLLSNSNIKIGDYKWYTSFIYTHPIKSSKNSGYGIGLAVENRLQLLKPILKDKSINELYTKPKIYLTDTERKEALDFLKSHSVNLDKPIFMINVLGSALQKTYPAEYMAQFINNIANSSEATLLFNYIPNQLEDVKCIYNLCAEKTKEQIKLTVFAPGFRSFLSILSHCDALLGNEGGAVNMAKALDVSTFSIFSPWVSKKAWGIFEDEKNVGIHLNDYKPQLFKGKKKKDLKKGTFSLYKELKPELFTGKLQKFLQNTL